MNVLLTKGVYAWSRIKVIATSWGRNDNVAWRTIRALNVVWSIVYITHHLRWLSFYIQTNRKFSEPEVKCGFREIPSKWVKVPWITEVPERPNHDAIHNAMQHNKGRVLIQKENQREKPMINHLWPTQLNPWLTISNSASKLDTSVVNSYYILLSVQQLCEKAQWRSTAPGPFINMADFFSNKSWTTLLLLVSFSDQIAP